MTTERETAAPPGTGTRRLSSEVHQTKRNRENHTLKPPAAPPRRTGPVSLY